MMKTLRRAGVVLAASLCAAALSSATSLPAQGDSIQPSAKAVPGIVPANASTLRSADVYLDKNGNRIPTPGTESAAQSSSAVAAKGACTPVSGRDDPHASKVEGQVSGHGWWKKGTCTKDRATVSNCLYEYYTDATWRQKDCSSPKTLKPGGGSSNWTNARNICNDELATDWRNHVDVDVIDEADTGEKPFNEARVLCRVY